MLKLALGGDTAYILEEDRESDSPTTFTIKTLTVAERMQLGMLVMEVTPENVADQFPALLAVCKIGIRKIEGDGIPRDMEVAEILDRITNPMVINELTNAITQHNQNNEEQIKNFTGQCVSPPRGEIAVAAHVSQGPRKRAERKKR